MLNHSEITKKYACYTLCRSWNNVKNLVLSTYRDKVGIRYRSTYVPPLNWLNFPSAFLTIKRYLTLLIKQQSRPHIFALSDSEMAYFGNTCRVKNSIFEQYLINTGHIIGFIPSIFWAIFGSFSAYLNNIWPIPMHQIIQTQHIFGNICLTLSIPIWAISDQYTQDYRIQHIWAIFGSLSADVLAISVSYTQDF